MKVDPRELFTELRDRAGDGPPGLDLARQADALERRLRLGRARPRRTLWFLWAGALAAAAAGLLLFVVRGDRSPSWRSTGGAVVMGTPIRVGPRQPIELRSSDGVVATLAPESEATLASASASEATVRLARGQVHTTVEPGRRRAVRVIAGPFTVTVVGTAFTVNWEPRERRVRVQVQHGRVRVDGPSAPGVILGPGERFEHAPDSPPAPSAAPDSPRVPSAVPPPAARAHRLAVRAPTPPERQMWQELMQQRRYAEAFDAARQLGLDRLARQLPRRQLADLADVARFAGQHAAAAELLESLRDRHARTEEAATAAFVLGRLHADHLGQRREAARWFAAYLKERPRGPLAEEALGRRIAVLADDDAQAARPLAQEYLRRHPHGAWAAFARRVLQTP